MYGCFGGGKMVIRKGLDTVKSLLFLYVTCCSFSLAATQYLPWLGNLYEFEWRNSLLSQYYPHLASPSCCRHYSSNDLFVTSSLCNAIDTNFALEGELTLAHTTRQSWGVDNFRLSGRYVWLDDVAGDLITLTTGAVLTQSFVPSLNDISSFHHGRSEAEIFVSFGRECSHGQPLWDSRMWGMLGIGFAERGFPWIRTLLAYEQRFCDCHEFRYMIETLWGLGHQRLCPHHFHGYGPIQHQSIDLSLRYTYLIEYFGALNIDYAYRIYARNFPERTQCVTIMLTKTFGLICFR